MDARVSISFSCRFARVWIPRAVKGSRIPTTVRPTAVVSRTLFAVSNGSFERCLERSSSTQAAMWMTPRKRRMAKSTSNARRCGSTCHHNGLRTDTSSTTKDDGTLPPGDGGGDASSTAGNPRSTGRCWCTQTPPAPPKSSSCISTRPGRRSPSRNASVAYSNRGFVTVNDASAMASQLARYLIARRSDYEDRYRTNFDSIPTMIPNMIVRKIEPSSSHRRRPVDLPVDASISVVGNIL